METTTWVKYFTLYIVTMDKGKGDMVPCMVAHLHTVLKLFQKAPDTLAWLECDVQFRMEAAASESHKWSCGDPWQYLACFPGWRDTKDPFSVTSQDSAPLTEPLQQLADPGPIWSQPSKKGKESAPWLVARATMESPLSKDPRTQEYAACLIEPREAAHTEVNVFLGTNVPTAVVWGNMVLWPALSL